MLHITFPKRRCSAKKPSSLHGMSHDTVDQSLQSDDVSSVLHSGHADIRPQAKLKVSQPNDPLEQEADKVAAEITAGAGKNSVVQNSTSQQTRSQQPVQRMCDECEEDVHRKPNETSSAKPSSDTTSTTNTANGITPVAVTSGGEPLSSTSRNFFESRLQTDLSGVRIHKDTKANAMSESINAKAFTLGSHIAFGAGQYQPESQSGKFLLAHELAHVLQQQRLGNADTAFRQLMDEDSQEPGVISGETISTDTTEVDSELDAEEMQASCRGAIPLQGDFGNHSPARDFTIPAPCRRIRLEITAQYYNTDAYCEACPSHLILMIDDREIRLPISTQGHSAAGFCGDGVEGAEPTTITRTITVGSGRHTRQFKKPAGGDSCRFWIRGSMSIL